MLRRCGPSARLTVSIDPAYSMMQMKIMFNYSFNRRLHSPLELCLWALLSAAACSDSVTGSKKAPAEQTEAHDHDHDPASDTKDMNSAGSGASDKPAMTMPKPSDKPTRYVILSTILGADTETSYLHLLSSFENVEIDPKQALELPGRASIATYDQWLFVADGEAPTITRYTVDAQGKFQEDGRVSFAAYTSDPVSLDEWHNVFISASKAYLTLDASTDMLIWDPSELAIDSQLELPELQRKGLDIDGSTLITQGKYVLRSVTWKDWDAYKTSEEQYLVVLDSEQDKLVDMLSETRCPALSSRVDKDEQGNLYFSNWIYNVTETLVNKAPHSCALRIKAGERVFDKDWMLEYPKLTEGRESAGFTYLENGHAFLSVFHNERVTIDAQTDPRELALSDNWRLWGVDLKAQTAKPIESLDFSGGGYTLLKVEEHTLLTQSTDDYDKTTVYEVTGDMDLTKRFELPGFSYQIGVLH